MRISEPNILEGPEYEKISTLYRYTGRSFFQLPKPWHGVYGCSGILSKHPSALQCRIIGAFFFVLSLCVKSICSFLCHCALLKLESFRASWTFLRFGNHRVIGEDFIC